MAVTATRLDSVASTTDANSYTTNNIAFQDNRLYLVAVLNTKATTPDTPSLGVAGGVTFVQVATILFNTVAAGLSRLTLFRGMAPSGTATATIGISFPAVQTGCSYAVDELDGCETGGASGASAIVEVASNAVDATAVPTASLAAVDVRNLVHASVGLDSNTTIGVGTSGYTELGADVGHGTPTARLGTFYDAASADRSPQFAAGASCDHATILVEVKDRGEAGSTAGQASTTGVGGASAGGSGSAAGAAATAAQGARIQSGQGDDAGVATTAAVGGATAMAAGTAAGAATTDGHGADTFAPTTAQAFGHATTVGNAQRLGHATGTRHIDDLVLIPGKLSPSRS